MPKADYRDDHAFAVIPTPPPNAPTIAQLVGETLHRSPDAAMELATLVQRKTGGNPFFINEYLRTLEREKLLTLNRESGARQWDMGERVVDGQSQICGWPA